MKRRRWLSSVAAAAALTVAGQGLSVASMPAQPAMTWPLVLDAYQLARTSEQPGDVDRALDLADAYLSTHPQDGLGWTYRGSLAALRARISWLPWKKLGLLNEGIRQMDEGVEIVRKSHPGSFVELVARMVRGITSANIPGTFGRGGVAFSDFQAVVRHTHFTTLSAVHRATVLAWLAVMYQRQGQGGEANRLQREAEALDPVVARQVRERAS